MSKLPPNHPAACGEANYIHEVM